MNDMENPNQTTSEPQKTENSGDRTYRQQQIVGN